MLNFVNIIYWYENFKMFDFHLSQMHIFCVKTVWKLHFFRKVITYLVLRTDVKLYILVPFIWQKKINNMDSNLEYK